MLRKLLTGLVLLALASCSSPAPKPAAVTDADPALWVLKDEDTTLYLFGTVHALKPGLSWFDEAVADAFNRSDTLVLELVLPPPAEMQALIQELGRAAGPETLSHTLPPGDAEKLRAALGQAGQPPDSLEGVKPWLAAVMLANVPAKRAGYAQEHGAEAVLSAAAVKAGKPVTGLETARAQFGYFDRLSLPAQRALLMQVIDGLPTANATLDAVVAAWGKGDADGIARLLNEDLAGQPELAEALLATRNRHWAAWIAARMEQPGTVFVAVGAGHLAGDRSVQAELARRGLRVVRVAY